MYQRIRTIWLLISTFTVALLHKNWTYNFRFLYFMNFCMQSIYIYIGVWLHIHIDVLFIKRRWKEIRKFDASCAGGLVRNHFPMQKYLAVNHFFFLGAPRRFYPQLLFCTSPSDLSSFITPIFVQQNHIKTGNEVFKSKQKDLLNKLWPSHHFFKVVLCSLTVSFNCFQSISTNFIREL